MVLVTLVYYGQISSIFNSSIFFSLILPLFVMYLQQFLYCHFLNYISQLTDSKVKNKKDVHIDMLYKETATLQAL